MIIMLNVTGWRKCFLIATVLFLFCFLPPGASLLSAASVENTERFDSLLEKVQTSPQSTSEAEVVELLRLSRNVGRPYPVSLAVAQYLAQQRNVSPALLALAAQSAVLSGDLRTAVSRYKNCLNIVQPGEAASNVAADLYALLIFVLGDHNDAYRTMTEEGPRFRDSLRARQFDAWYLDMARSEKDYVNLARRLAVIMNEQNPLEEERTHFWHHLDWLMDEMQSVKNEQKEAAGDFERLIPLIRDDAFRSARAAFIAANQKWYSGTYADDSARESAFVPVVNAAQKTFAARPRLETLKNILIVFGGGPDGFNHDKCREMWEMKGELVAKAFAQLDDSERQQLLDWEYRNRQMIEYVASPAAWSEAAARSQGWFKGRDLPDKMRFGVKTKNIEGYRSAARGLDGVLNPDAAVINALSRGVGARETVDYVMQNETWHLDFDDVSAMINGDLWNGWCALQGKKTDEMRNEKYALIEYFLNKYLVRSPAAVFDSNGVRDALYAAWQNYAAADQPPLAMINTLKNINWVPYDARTRKEVMGSAYSEFNRWARDVRKNKKDDQAAMAAISQLESAFKAAMELSSPTVDAVGDALAKNAAGLVLARQKKQGEQVAVLSRNLFNDVRNASVSKPAFGLALLKVLAEKTDEVDGFTFQLEMLKQLLADPRVTSGQDTLETLYFVRSLMDSRRWSWWRIGRSDEDKALQMADAFGAAVIRQLDNGVFSSRRLLDWMRGTHQGNGWNDRGRRKDVFVRVILEKEKGTNKALDEKVNATYLMHVVRHNLSDLNSDFPYETYFDDMFIKESIAEGSFSWDYWNEGRDRNNKVVNAAARVFAEYQRIPVGYGSAPAHYSVEDFFRWQERLLQADNQPRTQMLNALEGFYGTTRFDSIAMGRGRLDTFGANAGSRNAYFQRLEQYTTRAMAARVRMQPPSMAGMRNLFASTEFNADELEVLSTVIQRLGPNRWNKNELYENTVRKIQEGYVARNEPEKLLPLITEFWRIADDTGSSELQHDLVRQARIFMENDQQDIAAAYAITGSEMMGGKLSEDLRAAIQTIKTRSVAGMSRIIPVDRSDPKYPAFEAQMAYLTGRPENAWELYEPRMAMIREIFTELDPQFCIWLIERHTELTEFDDAESLARPMILWMDQNPSGFDPEIRAGLYVAYADIAFRRQEYPRARAQYERIAADDDFAGTVAQRVAELRVAEVDRLTRNYSRAESILDDLVRRRDPFIQAEGNLLLSRIKYDQEEYEEAMEYLNKVFAINPNHPDARIMQGELFLRLKKLVEATDVRVGLSAEQQILVPGRPLRVSLEDPNLAVVGQSANIGITVKTSSGDRESFSLLPFGDSRTRFEGQIMTELGAAVAGDGVLQVLGSDEITYDFSDEFKAAGGGRASQTQ